MNTLSASSGRAPGAFRTRLTLFLCDEANFRFVYIAVMFFSSLCLVRDLFYIAAGLSLIWGLFLFIRSYIIRGRFAYIRHRRVICLFMGFALFSCILHIQDNFIVNLYVLIFESVCFFFFFGLHAGRGRNACRREVWLILEFIIAATTVVMIGGFAMLAVYPRGTTVMGDPIAIYENRFVGIIFNANVTGFYAAAALIAININFAARIARRSFTRRRKLYYAFCALIDLIALFLSDSNDSLLMIMVYVCFVIMHALFKGYKPGVLSTLARLVALALSVVLVCYCALGARTMVQTSVSDMLGKASPESKISTGVATEGAAVRIRPDMEKRTKSTTFEHENTNLDSGRFGIWRQSAAMFKENPLFGIGKGNIVEYGRRYTGGLKYDDFHNGFLTILISCGFVGLSLFMVLTVSVAKMLMKAIFLHRNDNRRDGRVLLYLTAFCSAYCVYSFFEVALLADISYRVVFFWLLLGLAVSYAASYERRSLVTGENLSRSSRSVYSFSMWS